MSGLLVLSLAVSYVSLADSDADFREAFSEMCGANKAKGIQDRLEASKLVPQWSQAKSRNDTQQKVERTDLRLELFG